MKEKGIFQIADKQLSQFKKVDTLERDVMARTDEMSGRNLLMKKF